MQNKKVVYTHSVNGKIFYVGCGSVDRPFSKHSRSERWNYMTSSNSGIYDVKIVSEHDNQDVANKCEIKLIKKHLPACNVRDNPNIDPLPKININNMKYLNVPIDDSVLKALDEDSKKRRIQKRRIVEDVLMAHYKIKRAGSK